MSVQVEVCLVVDVFQFFEFEWEVELNICSGICIVCQIFVVIMEVQYFFRCVQGKVLFEVGFFLVFVLFYLFVGFDEVLYFYLFEFLYMENKLLGNDFILECFVNLGNIERQFLLGCFLYVEEVDKDILCGFWVQVKFVFCICDVVQLCGEYQVELLYFCLVVGVGIWVCDVQVFYYLFQVGQVVVGYSGIQVGFNF